MFMHIIVKYIPMEFYHGFPIINANFSFSSFVLHGVLSWFFITHYGVYGVTGHHFVLVEEKMTLIKGAIVLFCKV